jgi:large subunit ribosomal protein L10
MGSLRKIKETKIQEFQQSASESKAILLAEYKGLTVHQMEDLRHQLREAGGRLQVIKNTLAKIGLGNAGIDGLDDHLKGQLAFVFSTEDAVGGTKAAFEFSRKNPPFILKSGYFDGRVIDIAAIKELANLPGREELQARLVGTLMAPLAEFAGTMSAGLIEFVGTLDAKAVKMATD